MKEFYHCFNLSHGNSISDQDYIPRVEFHDVLMGSPFVIKMNLLQLHYRSVSQL